MANILGEIINSIKAKWGEIVVGVALIIILLLTLSLYGFSFKNINGDKGDDEGEGEDKEKSVDTIEIIYEGMTNKFDSLCDEEDLEKVCSDLGSGHGKRYSCNVAKCCVWAKNKNGEECIEGDKSGPMFKTDKSNMKYDEYYYLNKRYKL
tara:strand:+ start:30426 stop:30875 length:450 start_codon:yes stop_codon:yes gene_type:complete